MMKKALVIVLALAMLLVVFAACASEEPMESAGEVSDFSSEKHFDINDILQNGDESEEESNSVGSSTGAESTDEPSVSSDVSSAGTTSEPVSQDQSGDEQPPEESSASTPEESKGNQTSSQGANSQPSQGTTSTSSQGSTSENSQGTTSKPAETSQGTTSNPSQGTTSQPSGGELTGELVVSDKKYTYNGNDLMLLHVENKTALHLNVTIKGKYLDKSGKVLKEESQTYYAFPSGWNNYFIFRPKMTFDSFDYTLEVKEFKSTTTRDKLYAYNGDPVTKYAELTYSKNLIWSVDYIGLEPANALCLSYALVNRHPSIPIAIQFHVLILDEQGNIYLTDYELEEAVFGDGAFSGTSCTPVGGMDNGKFETLCRLKSQLKSEDKSIPSNVQGKFTAIFAIESIVDFNEVQLQLQ